MRVAHLHFVSQVAEKWLEHGFLVMFEGLLSMSATEKAMLEDTMSAVEAQVLSLAPRPNSSPT